MNKVYFSDIKNETWYDESGSLTYIFIPKKWWSIQAWVVAHRFSKEVQIFFMKKV
jgi:hypothetical protein